MRKRTKTRTSVHSRVDTLCARTSCDEADASRTGRRVRFTKTKKTEKIKSHVVYEH